MFCIDHSEIEELIKLFVFLGEKFRTFTSGGSLVPYYTENWRTMQTEDHAVFRVRACSHVHVALSETVGVPLGEPYYEIMIGATRENSSIVTSEIRIREGIDVTSVLQVKRIALFTNGIL